MTALPKASKQGGQKRWKASLSWPISPYRGEQQTTLCKGGILGMIGSMVEGNKHGPWNLRD